jgi:hypothetical protein
MMIGNKIIGHWICKSPTIPDGPKHERHTACLANNLGWVITKNRISTPQDPLMINSRSPTTQIAFIGQNAILTDCLTPN